MLCLTGHSPEDLEENKEEVFSDVTALLSSIKVRLMKSTRLTSAEIASTISDSDSDHSDHSDSDFDNNPPLLNPSAANRNSPPPPHYAVIEHEKEMKMELQSVLLANMPKHAYNATVKLICMQTHQKSLQSHYVVSKGLPKVHPFECTYKYDTLVKPPKSAEEDKNGTMRNYNGIVPVPEGSNREKVDDEVTHLGAYCSLKDCMELLLNKIRAIVKKIPEGTMEKALDKAFFLMCADGAEHNRLPKTDKNIITYSITLVSRYLIEDCGIYPSSGRWIVPHAQLRAKENIYSLRSILQFRLNACASSLPTECQGIPLYDIADGKALYCYTLHSHWSSNKNHFFFAAASVVTLHHPLTAAKCRQMKKPASC